MAVNINDNDINTIVLTLNVPGAQGPAGPTGATGATGDPGPANALTIGSVNTGTAGSAASATITGTVPNQVLNLTIPTGPQGPTGATGPKGADGGGITVAGEVATYSALPTGLTSGDAGKGYIVDADGKMYIWTGTSFPPNGSGQVFAGPAGPANSLSIGTVTTGATGVAAAATITGTAPTQVLNLTLPAGAVGATGPGVIPGGALNAVLIKASGTDFDTDWRATDNAATASTIVIRDAAGRAQVVDPSVAADIATKNYVDNVGTTASTASTVVRRDSAGNGNFARVFSAGSTPSTNSELAPKGYVDTQDATNLTAAKAYTDSQVSGTGVSAATPSALIRRDSAGRAQVVTPSAVADIATKGYADGLGVSAPTVSTIVRRDAAGRAQVVDPSAAADIATKNYVDTSFSNAPTLSDVDSEVATQIDLAPIVRRYNTTTGTVANRPNTSRPVWWILPSAFTIPYTGTTAGGSVAAVDGLDIISRY